MYHSTSYQELSSRYNTIEKQISDLEIYCKQKASTATFINQVAKDKTLLVGEGNLSFSLSLSQFQTIQNNFVTATTYEGKLNLNSITKENASKLKAKGVKVLHGIDATHLDRYFSKQCFETIIFQFPNVGSRQPLYGKNPNSILIYRFLKSAQLHLKTDGVILITTVKTPHYDGLFRFEEVAKKTGYQIIGEVPFYPKDFPEYQHTGTQEGEESILAKHKHYVTRYFQLK